MSKYNALWEYIRDSRQDALTLTMEQAGQIAGVPIDHSFLNCKKELLAYGYRVGKISLKAQTVEFIKQEEMEL